MALWRALGIIEMNEYYCYQCKFFRYFNDDEFTISFLDHSELAKFLKDKDGYNTGECVRFPPLLIPSFDVMTNINNIDSIQNKYLDRGESYTKLEDDYYHGCSPFVGVYNWCGEFKPAIKPERPRLNALLLLQE